MLTLSSRTRMLRQAALLICLCLVEAQWLPITRASDCSKQCSCSMACCRSNACHCHAHASAAKQHADHPGTTPTNDSSMRCACSHTAQQLMLLLPKTVIEDAFALRVPDANRKSRSLKLIHALPGFPPSLLHPPLRYEVCFMLGMA